MDYEDILFDVDDGVATLTINRPERGNMLRVRTALELADALRAVRADRDIDVAVLTGAGDKFFCIGGEHETPTRIDYSQTMPVVDVYELLDTIPKPVVAAVNGFAVGGGHVLQNMCDLAVASSNATFRQVGPVVGSFDAGYGTWYLEESIGRRRAKEMWYLNRKYTAEDALAMGLVNEVTRPEQLTDRTREVAQELRARGPQALAALKTAFGARHSGVVGQARLAHDLLLTPYRMSAEAAELSASFDQRRPPDRTQFRR
jgi:naphthoate synthase